MSLGKGVVMPSDYLRLAPPLLRDFLSYHQNIKMHSAKTVEEYFLDLRMFFRYLKLQHNPDLDSLNFDELDILDVDFQFIKSISSSDILSYMTFLSQKRSGLDRPGLSDDGLAPKSKARKRASIRSFFNYLTKTVHILEINPALSLDAPKMRKTLPQYLTETECNRLLDAVEGPFATRDYCILILFLSLGLRLSELVGINMQDLREDSLRVRGKGNKERILYLNTSCLEAVEDYLLERPAERVRDEDKEALFISRNSRRMNVRSVQLMVDKVLLQAGLDVQSYSPHKLRHSAATLMLQNGVDVRTLQDVLGHENLNTTQIYTHVDGEGLRIAAAANPIGRRKKQTKGE